MILENGYEIHLPKTICEPMIYHHKTLSLLIQTNHQQINQNDIINEYESYSYQHVIKTYSN